MYWSFFCCYAHSDTTILARCKWVSQWILQSYIFTLRRGTKFHLASQICPSKIHPIKNLASQIFVPSNISQIRIWPVKYLNYKKFVLSKIWQIVSSSPTLFRLIWSLSSLLSMTGSLAPNSAQVSAAVFQSNLPFSWKEQTSDPSDFL